MAINQNSLTFFSLLDILRGRAQDKPDQQAYIFLQNGETESGCLTYAELDQKARAIATRLQPLQGERALLLYPSGLEFIAAFFGCLYAGVVAVPAYPPKRNQTLSRLLAIAHDARPKVALTTTAIMTDLKKKWAKETVFAQLQWLATDSIAVNFIDANDRDVLSRPLDPKSLAFLQYTSGSTGMPKGVMVTHENIIHNQQGIQQAFGHSKQSVGVGWLPLFHDLGLIGHVFQPIYSGFPSILMPPVAFLQKPIRWLNAISKYGATTSGGPNFAYDLCIKKIQLEQLADLDLSSWDLAYTGAEPIRAETLKQFSQKFSRYGFMDRAFYPCYGMAETTLLSSGGEKGRSPVMQPPQAKEMQLPKAKKGLQTLVGCGNPFMDMTIEIVDPTSLMRCSPGDVGEIWVSGRSVAAGYWNSPQTTKEMFQAYLSDTGEGPFLRTGDLGFFRQGELFVTGRIKDMIIIRGQNHYPHDIELTVQKANPVLRPHSGAAFSVVIEGTEKLVIVQEVERTSLRRLNTDKVVGDIRQSVSLEHELNVYAVVLLKPGSLPKTSSGKIQRHTCRAKFLDGSLSGIGTSLLEQTPIPPQSQPLATKTNPHDKTVLISQFCQHISQVLDRPHTQVDPQQLIGTLGLDSLQAIDIKKYIEDTFGVIIPMEKFFENITVAQLATDIFNLTDPSPIISNAEPINNLPESQCLSEPPRHFKPATPSSHDHVSEAIQDQSIPFSLLYFSSNEADFVDDKYQLLVEGAKFADQHNFKAVWIPERHFHAFGGIYPNPSVLGAALAMVTQNIRIRAGSVVLPLHNPVRVAEEWSVVDNLSAGRVDLAFAMGWNPNDFVLSPDTYGDRHQILFDNINTVQRLWTGQAVSMPNGVGEETDIRIYPLPKQPQLDAWVTCSGSPERFQEAGRCGANVLTALLFQSIEELAEKIAIYREARSNHGYDPETGHVTLMLHTFVGEDIDEVRQKVRAPFLEYLKSSVNLWRQGSKDLDDLNPEEKEDLLSFAFERYFQSSALFGTPSSCLDRVKRLQKIGVNEIACLIDFGVDTHSVMASLDSLNSLRELANVNPEKTPHSSSAIAVSPPSNADTLGVFGGTSRPQKHHISLAKDTGAGSEDSPDIDMDSRLRLVYKSSQDVLQRAREFELPDQLRETGLLPYFRELEQNEGTTCVFDGRPVIMLGSNNYLGLTADKRVREATARAALEEGPSLTGSRLLNGSTRSHRQFEQKLAAFLGHEDALIFTTGYQANLGFISALMNEETTIVLDSEAHACIYDGAFMSRCNVIQYKHNELNDLEKQLRQVADQSATMVAIDGVYSMTGDIAPLPDIRALCDRYHVTLAVDDAHGLGMLGANGKGIEEQFQMVGSSDILCGTFSKSLASIGGWVAAEAKVIDWIRFHGRSMLFSASIPPTSLAAASMALDILITEPWRVQQLQKNAQYWQDGLHHLGFSVGDSTTAITPVMIGDDLLCMQFGKALLEAGVYVNSVVYPAVPRSKALLRTSVMATHSQHHLDQALDIFSTVGKQLKLIA
ncbi:MAG: MupA/Atu3671 family FMN-dependent luciferase-like monooxygenase [Cyanobacteria bacterium P01_F01_bin.150]